MFLDNIFIKYHFYLIISIKRINTSLLSLKIKGLADHEINFNYIKLN